MTWPHQSQGPPAAGHPPLPARPRALLLGRTANFLVFLLIGFAVASRLGVVQTHRVSSANMVPTLAVDDHLLVRAFGEEPLRGDVVLYRSPFEFDRLLLGRIVAVSGDRVELGAAGLLVGGRVLAALPAAADTGCTAEELDADACPLAAESIDNRLYYTRRAGGLSGLHFDPREVPEGRVFVLSDNRIDPRDSRIFGAIPHAAIVGVASFVYYAFDESGIRWDRISRPVS
ncbi:MAG: signal peptidase I [Candidatus Binatia bacterium]